MTIDDQLHEALRAIGKDKCPKCKRTIDRGDVAWNTASTDYGTPYSVMEIICQACDTEILYEETWAYVESLQEFIEELKELNL